jgi:hypothetical protein
VISNPALTRCCGLFPLLDAGGVGGTVTISLNGAGCTEDDILRGGPCGVAEAIAAIEDLIADVQAVLGEPESHGLVAKLNEAVKALHKVHLKPAINKLGDFTDQVRAHINSGKLAADDGQQLIDSAQAIIDLLQAPSKNSEHAAQASLEASTWSGVKKLYR